MQDAEKTGDPDARGSEQGGPTPPAEQDLTGHYGPVRIEWPRTVGYYGGLAAAVGFGVIEPPLGLFIAAVPFLKMLNRPGAIRPVRLLGQLVEGAAKPVGGDAEATITLNPTAANDDATRKPRPSMLEEARAIARGNRPAKPDAKAKPALAKGAAA